MIFFICLIWDDDAFWYVVIYIFKEKIFSLGGKLIKVTKNEYCINLCWCRFYCRQQMYMFGSGPVGAWKTKIYQQKPFLGCLKNTSSLIVKKVSKFQYNCGSKCFFECYMPWKCIEFISHEIIYGPKCAMVQLRGFNLCFDPIIECAFIYLISRYKKC